MEPQYIPEIEGNLRKHMIRVPKVIDQVSGIRIFGKLIKSLVFTTDIAIIRNCNANAVIAVYPFTPQPIITHSIINCSDVPVFCGVGGGTTTGKRVTNLAEDAEFQGAMGVVVNAPTPNETLQYLSKKVEIPIVITVASEKTDIAMRLESGATILNVSGAGKTVEIVRKIRREFPEVPIIATGGPTDETILRTIEAGANAITYTPPSNGEIFKHKMNKYRNEEDII
jgi:Dihydrodipicolinate synthase/N-acetylneuraminate lyase